MCCILATGTGGSFGGAGGLPETQGSYGGMNGGMGGQMMGGQQGIDSGGGAYGQQQQTPSLVGQAFSAGHSGMQHMQGAPGAHGTIAICQIECNIGFSSGVNLLHGSSDDTLDCNKHILIYAIKMVIYV